MLRESITDGRKQAGASTSTPVVITRCGKVGHPYAMRWPDGIRSSIWESSVTCVACRQKNP